jgi:NADH:ubiquinone oxidoreductase subunit D
MRNPEHTLAVAERAQLVVGHQTSDVVAMLGSLNITAAELDR